MIYYLSTYTDESSVTEPFQPFAMQARRKIFTDSGAPLLNAVY